MNIDWNKYFEHIYIISRCKNFDRRKKLDEQLLNIGLTNYKYWFVPDYDFDNSKIFQPNEFLSISHKRCGIGHYSLWKRIYELEYNNILIIEDDAAFLKDLNTIIEVLEDFESNKSDIYLFDYANYNDPNNHPKVYLMSTVYYVNYVGLNYLISMHERYNVAIDNYFIDFSVTRDEEYTFIGDYMVYPPDKYVTMTFDQNDMNTNLAISKTHLAIQQDKEYQNLDKSLYYS